MSSTAPLFVKVHSSRGYAGGLWKVKARDTRHYTVENVQTKDKVTLFIGHTYEDFETKRASFEERKAFADTLGNRLHKQGKRGK